MLGIVLWLVYLVFATCSKMSPRLYLESLYPNQGCYSVIPILGNKILDAQFHLDRIIRGYKLLTKENLLESDETLNERALEKIQCMLDAYGTPTTAAGIMTLVMHRTSSMHVTFDAICNTMNSDIYTSSKSPPHLFVDIHYYERRSPAAKDISWPIERKVIEQSRYRKDIAESLMCTKSLIYDGGTFSDVLTEGLISNFYAIEEGGVVVTSPDDIVLPGSMAKLIKGICLKNGIPYKHKLLCLSDIQSWRATFICSSCKPLHCLAGIYVPPTSPRIGSDGFLHSFQKENDASAITDFLKSELSSFFQKAVGQSHIDAYGVKWF